VAKIPFRRKRNEHDSIRPIGKVFPCAENRAGREREKSCRAETGTRFVVPPCNPPGVASRHPMMVAVSIQVFRHPSTGPFTTAVQPGHGRWYRAPKMWNRKRLLNRNKIRIIHTIGTAHQ
jgi:hypothetical protein